MKPVSLITGTFRFTPKDHNGLTVSDIHMAVDKNQIWFNLWAVPFALTAQAGSAAGAPTTAAGSSSSSDGSSA
jgi:hypothetical protein